MKVSRNFWLNQFDNFVEGTDLKTNEYCNVYRRIISNPKYASHLDYDLKRRMFNMSKYAYNRELINKPFLNNLINCHINEVKGYYIEKGYKFLNSDFNTYKDELINNYLKQINELESAYEESYNRNMNMLSFIQILINNYDESIEMRQSMYK